MNGGNMFLPARILKLIVLVTSGIAMCLIQAQPTLHPNAEPAGLGATTSISLPTTPGILSAIDDGKKLIKRLDGSTITAEEIDGTVAGLMTGAEVTGVAIAIFNKGEIVYLKSYGLRDTEKNLPLSVDSVMSVASLSKAAFAYLAMELVDQGVLDLDRPVYTYLPKPLPGYANYADLANDPRYKQITARMLLNHTSGFANFRGAEEDGKLRIHFAPGSRFAYSGEGINLLQFVVETITKEPLEQLMQEHIFRPLEMTRTSMVWQDSFEGNYAANYDEYGKPQASPKWHQAIAAGSMLTTPSDLSRFLQAVMEGRFLGKRTLDQMLHAQIQITSKYEFPTLGDETTDKNEAIRLSYGLGWGLYWTPYGKAFFKEGHNDGWRDYAVCFEELKSGIVIMTNSANGEGIYKDLLETLLRDTFTPIEWERYTPFSELPPRKPLAK
jgi:CubicO group peptidase (beta-lactamase class C family)